jgi:hypothetical protein
VKVYLDEDLSPAIAALLRKHGLDTTTAYEVGNVQLDDRAQLAYAAREGRAIITANVVDFIEHAHEAVATNTEHAGIILIPSSFRGDEFQAIADGIVQAVKPYRSGLRGFVLYVSRV